ncbi:MAG TPA: hypothetical protein VEB59_08225 [Gemmatimonadales bacterium]|nr:hypothetical protein [Gemmatimonadales bacterium]
MRIFVPHPGFLLLAEGLSLAAAAVPLGVAQPSGDQAVLVSVLVGLGSSAAIVLAVGVWAIKDHLALRRERSHDQTASQAREQELREELERRMATMHEQNLARFEEIKGKLDPIVTLMVGALGRRGLIEEQARNIERRHELAQDVQLLYAYLDALGRWAERLGEKQGVPFDPPSLTPRRRATDALDG